MPAYIKIPDIDGEVERVEDVKLFAVGRELRVRLHAQRGGEAPRLPAAARDDRNQARLTAADDSSVSHQAPQGRSPRYRHRECI